METVSSNHVINLATLADGKSSGEIISHNGYAWASIAPLIELPSIHLTNSVLYYNGSAWSSTSLASLLPNGITNGNVLTWNGSTWAPVAAPIELPAGVTVNNILKWNGSAWISAAADSELPASATIGNILKWNGSAWVAATVVSTLPSASTNNVLKWNGSAWVASTPPTELPASATTGNILKWNGSAWVATAPTVELPASAVTNQVLAWNGSSWAATTASGGGQSFEAINTNSTTVGTIDITKSHTSMRGTPYVEWVAKIADNNSGQGCNMTLTSNSVISFSNNFSAVTAYNANGTTGGTSTFNAARDGTLISYSKTGTVQWIARYTATGIYGTSMSVDSSDNIYATFFNGGGTTIAYNSDGSAFGTTLTNSGGFDMNVVKYSSTGFVQYLFKIASSGDDYHCNICQYGNYFYLVVRTLGNANIYNANGTLFTTVTNLGSHDGFVVKYSNTGTAQWYARVGSSGLEYMIGLTVDNDESVYVSGYYSSTVTIYNAANVSSGATLTTASSSYYFVKYNAAGSYIWSAKIDMLCGPGLETTYMTHYNGVIYMIATYDSPSAVVYNANGTIFTTLSFTGSTRNMAIIKYSTTGNCLGAYQIATSKIDRAFIKVNNLGIFVYGYINATGGYFYNFDGTQYPVQLTISGTNSEFVCWYSHDGYLLWITTITNGSSNLPGGMEIDKTDIYFNLSFNASSVTVPAFIGDIGLSVSRTNTYDSVLAKISLAAAYTMANPSSTIYKTLTSDSRTGAIMKITPATSIVGRSKTYARLYLPRSGSSCSLIWNGTNWRIVADNDVIYE